MKKYEVQMQVISGNSGLWISFMTESNQKAFEFDSMETASLSAEQLRLEYSKETRVIENVYESSI